MVARPFDDRERAAVPHAEALADAATDERHAAGGAVEEGIARDHLAPVVPRTRRRPHDDLAARPPLAAIAVRFAVEHEAHAVHAEGAEALPGRSTQMQLHRARGDWIRVRHLHDLTGDPRANGTICIGDWQQQIHGAEPAVEEAQLAQHALVDARAGGGRVVACLYGVKRAVPLATGKQAV